MASQGVEAKIRELAERHSRMLKRRVNARAREVAKDDGSHYPVYRALGVSDEEGRRLDAGQGTGMVAHDNAGRFLEEAAKLCFLERFPDSGSREVPNVLNVPSRDIEIDCVLGGERAIEFKWGVAAMDWDHIGAEKARVRSVRRAGYKPVLVTFYRPSGKDAQKMQGALEMLYDFEDGESHCGEDAWTFVHHHSHVDLKSLLEEIAEERMSES